MTAAERKKSQENGQDPPDLRLPVLRGGLQPVARALRGLRRLEHDPGGDGGRPRPVRPRRHPALARPRPDLPAGGADRRGQGGAPHGERHRRARPGDGRRLRARLGDPARRRSRHRQVDPADAGRRRDGPAGCGRRLHLRRGGGGAGAPAGGTPRPRPGHRATRRPDQRRGHRRDPEPGQAPGAGGDRFDPDHVDRDRRIGPRHGHAGALLRAGADPLRQDDRHGGDPGRPRHQGRADRGPRVVEHMVDAVASFEGDQGTISASCAP